MSAVAEHLRHALSLPVVHKFGGSSLETADAIRQCAAILDQESAPRAYIVVSAARGVTDALINLVATAIANGDWRRELTRRKHRQQRLIRELLSGGAAREVTEMLDADCRRLRELLRACAVLGSAPPSATDAIVASGELWSMRLVTAVLCSRNQSTVSLDAREFLRAHRNSTAPQIDWQQSQALFDAIAASLTTRFIVVPGFIARNTADGETLTLGRNGSDWSATILGRLANADSVTIWSDVAGVLDADPRVVADARPQAMIARDVASTLAENGARILHPATLAPLDDCDTRVVVRCTFAPQTAGTMIVNDCSLPETMIAASEDNQPGDSCHRQISAIGRRIETAQAIRSLQTAGLSPRSIQSDAHSLRVELPAADAARAQRIWHRTLCRRETALSVALLGVGTVGKALLRMLADNNTSGIRLLAVANSSNMLLDATGLDTRTVARRLRTAATPTDPREIARFLLAHCEAAPVIVDATSGEQTANLHQQWLTLGIHVVTANKQAAVNGCSERLPRDDVHYGDSATVGAGLPVLSTIRRLRAAGDDIRLVEGILSGSLAYIFHAMQLGKPFSRAVLAARRAGCTEPDPCHDLNGSDVAHKLAIIAHAAGIPLPSKPIAAESLLSTGAHQTPLTALLRERDQHWKARLRGARTHGEVLRYIAGIDANGETDIGVRSIAMSNPLAQTEDAENCVVIHTAARQTPLIIRGIGAGADVTAHALLADLADIRQQFG